MNLSIKILLPFLLSAACLVPASAQRQKKGKETVALDSMVVQKLNAMEDTLGVLAYAVVNDSIEKERFAACKVLITSLVKALKTENSFHYPFDRLKSISILAPPDSSFRIFTWQLYVNDSTYRYYGAIQMNEPQLKLYPLIDRSFDMDATAAYDQLAPDNWYGALYYNLRQFDTREGRKYLLFGYDAFEFFEKRKLLDVLSIDKTGKPVFGAAVFERSPAKPGPKEQRLLLEFSSEASVRLNWDEQYKMILFDHLIPFPSPFGRGMTAVPDGSYDGLKLEKGKWVFIDKVFNDSQDKPPTPAPVLESRKGKDIMGRDKGAKGSLRD